MAKRDPKLDEALSFLPADGSPISHSAWRAAILAAGRYELLQQTQKARRAGDVVFEIGDMNDPVATHTVRRAVAAPAAAAPAAAPAAVPPRPQTTGG